MIRKQGIVLLLSSLIPASGAEWRVCNQQGCQYPATASGVRNAIAGAGCGDSIVIEGGATITITGQADVFSIDKACTPGNELVISSSVSSDWLPGAGERISPGYLPLLPLFDVVAFTWNTPIFATGTGARGIILRNLAIRMRIPDKACPQGYDCAPYAIIRIGPGSPTGLSDMASNITLDHIYITGDFDPTKRVKNPVMVNGSVSVRDSFFDDIHKAPNDEGYHVYITNESTGPFRLINNYFGGGVGIGSLTGGGGGVLFTTGQPHPRDYVVEHNHFYNSPRFYEGSPNYVGDANRPCIKNVFELKTGSDAIIRWNSGENSFNGCGNQYNGFVFTPRNIAWKMGGTATLSGDRLTATISNYSSPGGLLPPRVGNKLGIAKIASPVPGYMAMGQYEWRTIVSADVTNHAYVVDSPFSADLPTLANAEWALDCIPWGHISNILVYGNYLRNVANGMLSGGREDSGDGGILSGLTFKNNLIVNDSPLMRATGLQWFQEELVKVVNGGTDITVDNNTYIVKDSLNSYSRVPTFFAQFEYGDATDHGTNLKVRNNIGSYGQYGIFSSGVGTNLNYVWNQKNDDGLEFRNNVLLGVPYVNESWDWGSHLSSCTPPRICTGNQFVIGNPTVDFHSWVADPDGHDYGVQPSLALDGHDGATVGVDPEQVPLIKGLTVVPGAKHLTFSWRVSQVLSPLACSLEVSPDQQLISDDGTFTLVAALRPDYFKLANFDTHNPRAVMLSGGLERTFQVGEDATATDDQGVVRDLSLSPTTNYYYRLMCGGTTERGAVQTIDPEAVVTSATGTYSVDIYYKAVLGSSVRARYGRLVGGATSETETTPCSTQCTIALSWTRGRSLVVYVDEYDNTGRLVLAAPRPIVVPSP
jgi:hypothetical protein